jgi:hypothetical protein
VAIGESGTFPPSYSVLFPTPSMTLMISFAVWLIVWSDAVSISAVTS